MPSNISAIDPYEDVYVVEQRVLPGRSKPAQRRSPRYEKSTRRSPHCKGNAQFRSNKRRVA